MIFFLYWIFANEFFDLKAIFINILPLVRNFNSEYIHSINGNFWFLHTLIEFYLGFPILLKLYRTLNRTTFVIITYIVVIIYISWYTFALGIDSMRLNPYSAFFLNYLYDFTLGIVFADIFIRKRSVTLKKNILLKLILVFLIFETVGFIMSQLGNAGRNFNDLFFSLGFLIFTFITSTLIYFYLMCYDFIRKTIKYMQKLVYDTYLTHHPVIKISGFLVIENIFYLPLVLFGVLTAAWLNYTFSHVIKNFFVKGKNDAAV